MHTLNAPDFFEVMAKLLTQGVGSSTGARIPCSTKELSSSFIFSLSAVGALLARVRTGLLLLSPTDGQIYLSVVVSVLQRIAA